MRPFILRFGLLLSIATSATFSSAQQTLQQPAAKPLFKLQEVMIPVRDGVHLQTVILTPIDQKGPLPILFRRTPYGVPDKAPEQMPSSLKELAQDGYIFVIQNLRGRFKSEGVFNLSSWVDLKDPKATNETTDAYDSIDWLVKNVPNNNGKVGMFGVSYDGLTTAMTLLHPHPALKAISEQASPVDQWMNDDDHRYGALRESYDFEYAVMEQADKNENTHFDFETYDTYQWYLDLGPLSNINAKYLHGSIPYWNSIVEHPDYDDFWKKEAWVTQLHASTVPNLNVAGFWDQEDPVGSVADLSSRRRERSPAHQLHRRRSVVPRRVADARKATASASSRSAGTKLPASSAKISKRRFSATTCTARRRSLRGRLARFRADRTPGTPIQRGRRKKRSRRSFICMPTARCHSAPGARKRRQAIENTFPIRRTRCRIASARSRPPIPPATGARGKSRISASSIIVPTCCHSSAQPLDRDLTVTGPLAANLFASTSGTDSDFVVKLIDVYPENAQKNAWNPDEGPKPGQYAQSLNGYELPIAMEVRRGRYLKSYEKPSAADPEPANRVEVPLRDHDHVFLKGHRLMVQVQSTWFPVIDRNPQKFVPSIYQAAASDFVSATQRIYCSPEMPSHLILPVVQ